MADDSLVAPMDQSAPQQPTPAPAPQPGAQPSEPIGAKPDKPLDRDLIKLPVMQALMVGSPPAVSAPIKDFEKRGEADILRKNKKDLMDAGFGFYRSMSGQIGVLFNMLHIHPQDLMRADRMGKLTQIAPSYDAVHHAVSKSGMHNPVLKPSAIPSTAANPTPAPPPQLSASLPPGGSPTPLPATPARPASAGVQRRVMNAQQTNLQPGAPTSGPAPGQGRIMNSILKGIA